MTEITIEQWQCPIEAHHTREFDGHPRPTVTWSLPATSADGTKVSVARCATEGCGYDSLTDVDPACLQCGQRRSTIRSEGLFCCTLSGGETSEIDQEWEHHRYAEWTDAELAQHGVKPEAFERHRRTDASIFMWIACEDQVRGHMPASREVEAEMFGVAIGTCLACGQTPSAASTPTSEEIS